MKDKKDIIVLYHEFSAFLDIAGDFQPGDPCPTGHLDRYEWAEVQRKAGLKQTTCPTCGLWMFPQEFAECFPLHHDPRCGARKPICLSCASQLEGIRS